MRLLIAEDEKSLSKALLAIVEKDGYSADAVYDGVEAMDYLETNNYDAMILDIMMPKMDGFAVLKTLREKENPIPVLILSARSETDDKVAGLDGGANDYLTKPFSPKELLARIRVMTRRQTQAADSTLKLGNIILDRALNELSSPTGNFHLTNKEFQIMEFLMCNPKHLIPTERLMEKIWGYENNAELNVVWVYISYLRKKLDALHADIQIKATRNAGYSLEVIE